jgi:hypothetical protein
MLIHTIKRHANDSPSVALRVFEYAAGRHPHFLCSPEFALAYAECTMAVSGTPCLKGEMKYHPAWIWIFPLFFVLLNMTLIITHTHIYMYNYQVRIVFVIVEAYSRGVSVL